MHRWSLAGAAGAAVRNPPAAGDPPQPDPPTDLLPTEQVPAVRRPRRHWLLQAAPRPPVPTDYPSRLHARTVAARVGLWLGIAFTVCCVTGLFSHLLQHPPDWFAPPIRPVWLYRLTQGVHVTTGIASIPLLLIKLWTVSPRFWQWPPITSVVNALERVSLFLLIGAAFFQLITGLLNVAEFYPWAFFFPPVHYAVSWVLMGALAVHIAVKLPVIRQALHTGIEGGELTSGLPDSPPAPADSAAREATAGDRALDQRAVPPTHQGPLSRRGLLALAGGSAAVAVLATVGDKIPALRPLAALAQRDGTGPQGLPVNRTALAAGVTSLASDASYRLSVVGPSGTVRLSIAQLRAMPQITAELPISCVEGWSQSATWTGVPLRDLLAAVGAQGSGARMVSAEIGLYAISTVSPALAADELTLIALDLAGEPLHIDHGYPARLIAPSRPGALQTKWLQRIEAI